MGGERERERERERETERKREREELEKLLQFCSFVLLPVPWEESRATQEKHQGLSQDRKRETVVNIFIEISFLFWGGNSAPTL
jgi:hypothetical protein